MRHDIEFVCTFDGERWALCSCGWGTETTHNADELDGWVMEHWRQRDTPATTR